VRRYRKHQRIEVLWIDTVTEPEWRNEGDMKKRPDADCRTIGYYYNHDKEFLYLCHTISRTESDRTSIPLGAIKRVRIVK